MILTGSMCLNELAVDQMKDVSCTHGKNPLHKKVWGPKNTVLKTLRSILKWSHDQSVSLILSIRVPKILAENSNFMALISSFDPKKAQMIKKLVKY